MKCRHYHSRGDSQTEAAVIVKYEVPDLGWNVVLFKRGFHQLVCNGPIGIGKVKPEDCRISFAFSSFPNQLGDHSCMLNAPCNLWDTTLLYWTVWWYLSSPPLESRLPLHVSTAEPPFPSSIGLWGLSIVALRVWGISYRQQMAHHLNPMLN